MKKNYFFWGAVGTAIALGAHLVQAQYANANPSQPRLVTDPACYMESSSGNHISLQSICGKSDESQLPPLDPNMPVQAPIQLTDKPSELWKTLPDLKVPIQEGKTRPALPESPGESAPTESKSGK